MKSKIINLLLSRKNYQKIEIYFSYIKFVTFFLMLIFAMSLIFIFIKFQDQNKEIASILKEKKIYLESSRDLSTNEANLSFIQKKYDALKEYEKKDIKPLKYFSLLIKALSQKSTDLPIPIVPSIIESTDSAIIASDSSDLAEYKLVEEGKITSFKLDQNRQVVFGMSFVNFQRVIDFLTFVESEDFLKHFKELSFNQFELKNLNNLTVKSENYELSFKGVFNQINEDTY